MNTTSNNYAISILNTEKERLKSLKPKEFKEWGNYEFQVPLDRMKAYYQNKQRIQDINVAISLLSKSNFDIIHLLANYSMFLSDEYDVHIGFDMVNYFLDKNSNKQPIK